MPFETVTEKVKKSTHKYVQKPGQPKKALAVVNDQIAWAQLMDYRNMGYIGILEEQKDKVLCEDEGCDLKDVVDDLSKVCHVCYLGGLLFSKARVMDDVPLSDLSASLEVGEPIAIDGDDVELAVKDPLKLVFDPWTLALCESAFERSHSFYEVEIDNITDDCDLSQDCDSDDPYDDCGESEYDRFRDSLYEEGRAAATYLATLESKVGNDFRTTDPSDAATCIAYNMRDNKGTFVPTYFAPDALALLKKRKRTGGPAKRAA